MSKLANKLDKLLALGWLVFWPVVLSGVNVAVWFWLRKAGISLYIAGDEGVMTSGTSALLFTIYGLLTALICVTVWNQWEAVQSAVKTVDEAKFREYKDKRLPLPLKLVMLMFSLFIVFAFHLMTYRNVLDGAYTSFVVAMALSLPWFVIMDLDNPFTGYWNVKGKIPPEWMKD